MDILSNFLNWGILGANKWPSIHLCLGGFLYAILCFRIPSKSAWKAVLLYMIVWEIYQYFCYPGIDALLLHKSFEQYVYDTVGDIFLGLCGILLVSIGQFLTSWKILKEIKILQEREQKRKKAMRNISSLKNFFRPNLPSF